MAIRLGLNFVFGTKKKPKEKPKFITIPNEFHDKLDKLSLNQCNEIVKASTNSKGKGKGSGKNIGKEK